MQTFLPYDDYTKVASVLDPKRKGNQCYREVLTLLNGGWRHHPASKMWRNHEYELCMYGAALAFSLIIDGKKATGEKWFNYYIDRSGTYLNTGKPWWIGYEPFHSAHRSNLLRKDPIWYGQFGWSESDDMPYIWPV